MWRKGTLSDTGAVYRCYCELLDYEEKNGANTVWKKGVYPTERTALEAIEAGDMYVFEENGEILASVIIDGRQPAEYDSVPWTCEAEEGEVYVIHTLCVSPRAAGQGVGTAAVRFAAEMGRQNNKKAIRLDTGAQNIPAVRLYEKLGFRRAGEGKILLGREILNCRQLFFELLL